MSKKDGYLEFFSYFNISEEKFINFAKESIIFIKQEKAKQEWDILKSKILNEKENVYVRNFGRNGQGGHLYQEVYKQLFLANIIVDPSNNNYPTKLLEKSVGLVKNKNLYNYQVSHIFGLTKNPYAFCAPWNVVFIPKILDPFTGHESQGEITEKITAMYRRLMWDKYEDLISDYNQIMEKYREVIKSEIEKYKALSKRKNDIYSRFIESVNIEFNVIEKI